MGGREVRGGFGRQRAAGCRFGGTLLELRVLRQGLALGRHDSLFGCGGLEK